MENADWWNTLEAFIPFGKQRKWTDEVQSCLRLFLPRK